MSTHTKTACSCHCNPCQCPSPTGLGCLSDACPPRPCFFNGQLITADDLNAMMIYLRTKDALMAKLVSGWGVLGGLRVDAGLGVPHMALSNSPLSPNPQILAGTTLSIGGGVAVDVRGQLLSLCAPLIADALELSRHAPTTPRQDTCERWFPGLTIPLCRQSHGFAASDYLIVVEGRELPARPVPQFAGGGACDPAPACDFSRTLEEVEVRLVPTATVDLATYLITGCLDPVRLPIAVSFDIATGAISFPALKNDIDECALIDALNEVVVGLCCERPAVVIGRVLLTANPGGLTGNLPRVPVYTIVQDFRPVRRVLVPNAMRCLLERATPGPVIGGPPVPAPNPGGGDNQ